MSYFSFKASKVVVILIALPFAFLPIPSLFAS
jgi:hypothetical protein